MQKIIYIFIINLIFFSCSFNKNKQKREKEYNNKDSNKISTSYKPYKLSIDKWNNAKKEYKNSYTYTVDFSSFSGYRTTTVITVNQGKVVKRVFYETDPTTNTPMPKKEAKPKFIEDKNNINSHNEGSPAVTIDQLYSDCSEKYLTADRRENIITFDVDNYGILNICGYTPKNCMDDCFIGISIGKIIWNK